MTTPTTSPLRVRLIVPAIASLLAFTATCDSTAVPQARLASSEAAVRGAQEVGAQSEPQAALHLKLAQEQREKAEALIKDGKNEEAEGLLMRAEADAELAIALAKAAALHIEAQRAAEQVDELKKKL